MEIHNTGTLLSDRNALEKIIFNLLSNAFKYTTKGGYIHLEVTQDIRHALFHVLSFYFSGKIFFDHQAGDRHGP